MASARRRRPGLVPAFAQPYGYDRDRPPETVTDAYRFARFVSVASDVPTFGSFGAAAAREEGDTDFDGPGSTSRPRSRR